MSLADAIKSIRKRFGSVSIVKGVKSAAIITDRFPTGSIGLDLALGGGYPMGHITVLWGPPGAGKGFLVAKAMARAKSSVLIVTEGIDTEWLIRCGVNMDTVYISQPTTLEEALQITKYCVRSNELDVVAIDSVVGISDMAEDEVSIEEDRYSKIPRLLNRFMRGLQSSLQPQDDDGELVGNRTVVLLVNQSREKLGAVGWDIEMFSGGRGMKHGNHAEVKLRAVADVYTESETWLRNRQGELEKADTKLPVGQIVEWRTKHTKHCPPGRVGRFVLYHTGEQAGQVDTVDEIMRYGLISGIIQQDGRRYILGQYTFNGKAELEAEFRSCKALQGQVLEGLTSAAQVT